MSGRLAKYLRAALTPSLWPVLARRVMPGMEHAAMLALVRPATLIDVGANKGQFSAIARHVRPDLAIVAFEPLPEPRARYEKIIGQPYRLHGCALGAAETSAEFFVTDRADSSSLLRPGASQQEAYGVSLERTLVVPVRRLDGCVAASDLVAPVLLKIDTQGGELETLKGATGLFAAIDHIYVELSFHELYEGQPLADDVICFLRHHGYRLAGVYNMSVTGSMGQTQADMLFVRAGRAAA